MTKIRCLICNKEFTRPCSHAWQVHGVSARDYKEAFGLDLKKGIATEEYRDRMREHVVDNYPKVVGKNLLSKGKVSRFKKGQPDIGVYPRSEQTLERIRGYKRYGKEPSKRMTLPCDECGKSITRTEYALSHSKKHFCSRSCSTVANNRGRAKV